MNTDELIHKRILNHEKRIKNKDKTNKLVYMPGDRVRLQNIKTKDFTLTDTVESQRVVDEGQIVSYNIQTDAGYPTTRHCRFLRPLVTAGPKECITDPDIPKYGEATTEQDLPHNADIREQSADIQSRIIKVKCIKPSPKMGGKTPF